MQRDETSVAPPLAATAISPATAPEERPTAATTPRKLPQPRPIMSPPLHTQTQSTLAPTSEYVRYLLLALPSRYIPRGIFGTVMEDAPYKATGWIGKVGSWLAKPGAWLQKKFPESTLKQKEALTYNSVLGVGSLLLTASYSHTVYKDIRNIFGEAVAEEFDKPADQVTTNDMRRSKNRMVQKTMENFWTRTASRLMTDLLFFPAAAMRSTSLGDLMVGVKAAQAFADTWKRKTTMFEDLITFVNNKINPRNGLGQEINFGEVFDLYQHYAIAYTPDRAFKNVIDRGSLEGARWAESQPIFQRITELMNKTYAYKHTTAIDETTGDPRPQAHFALPQFIYLLGHDLIDVRAPKRTQVTIEVANSYGIGAVKDMQAMLAQGQTLDEVMARYPVTLPTPEVVKGRPEFNGVISKGSTMQLDGVAGAEQAPPMSQIDAATVQGRHAMVPESALVTL